MDRRGFLKTITAFAALAAAKNALGNFVYAPETFSAASEVISGTPVTVIRDQTFFLDKLYVIEVDNVLILNCRFYFRGEGPLLEIKAKNCTMRNCVFTPHWPKILIDGQPYNTLADAVESAVGGSTILVIPS